MVYCPFCERYYSKHYFNRHLQSKKCRDKQEQFKIKFEILKSKQNKKSKKKKTVDERFIVYFN